MCDKDKKVRKNISVSNSSVIIAMKRTGGIEKSTSWKIGPKLQNLRDKSTGR